jgi:probable rRNA maturation factor
MLEVEVLGSAPLREGLRPVEIRRLCSATAARLGVHDGHVAVEFVDASRIAALNAMHRGQARATDVLSFPIDGVDVAQRAEAEQVRDLAPDPPPRELGDVVICAEHTADLREAVVHGMLHLLGMDHERDHGEMFAVQDELLAEAHR